MVKIFAIYKLKLGMSFQDYVDWSINTDQRITSSQAGVHSFKVYSLKEQEEEKIPTQIMEVIEVDSLEQWEKVKSGSAMSEVMKGFNYYVDESTVKLLYGKKIE